MVSTIPSKPRSVPLAVYVDEAEQRLEKALLEPHVFVDMRDLQEPHIIPGFTASLDAIIARSQAIREPYRFSDPEGSFLTEALTNDGSIRDPASHFSPHYDASGTYPISGFVDAFNKHMNHPHGKNPRYTILRDESHPTGMMLAQVPADGRITPVRVPLDIARSLKRLRSVSELYDQLKESESNA
jgi:hypothetical protein